MNILNFGVAHLSLSWQALSPTPEVASSQIFGRVGRSRSVGLRCRRVRLLNFQTRRCLWGTWPSPLYRSRMATTSESRLTNLELSMWQYFCSSVTKPMRAVVLAGCLAHNVWNSVHKRASANSQGRNFSVDESHTWDSFVKQKFF